MSYFITDDHVFEVLANTDYLSAADLLDHAEEFADATGVPLDRVHVFNVHTSNRYKGKLALYARRAHCLILPEKRFGLGAWTMERWLTY